MATTYTSNLKLAKPAVADRYWDVPLNANTSAIDALAPIAGLAVTLHETPSTTLTVAISAGKYRKADGSIATYAGSSSTSITAASTKVLYLDASGTLQVQASYPATTHVRLATVVADTTTIASITDDRVSAAVSLFTGLVNAADDAAAAAASVPIGGLYHNAGAVRVRLT